MERPTYWLWIREEAARIKSDGCTLVSQLKQDCCFEHDLAYYYGKDPLDAFYVGWPAARKITKAEADKEFAACCGKPISLWRYPGVTIGGWFSWIKNRSQR
jgi:hypothetical protein